MWIMKAIVEGGQILFNKLGLINGDEINPETAGDGLSYDNGYNVNVDGDSIEINADILQVNLNPDGAISKSAAGLKVEVDDESIEIATNKIQAKLDPAGALSKSATGMKVEVDDQSIEIVDNKIQAKLDPDGAISKSAAGLKVEVDNVTIKIIDNTLSVPDSGSTAPWSEEDYVALPPIAEASLIDLVSGFIIDFQGNINLGFGDLKPRTLGTINSLGSLAAVPSWAALEGRRFLLTARDGCYFNIKNNGDPPVGDYRKIITRTETDLYEVTKALFSYSAAFDCWFLLSYEGRYTWFKRYDIPPTPPAPINPISGFIPATPGEGLPYKGFYQVDVFIKVKEYEEDMLTQAITTAAQSMSLVAGGWVLPVDLSGNVGAASPSPIYWYNNSLQGSCILEITDDVCANRLIEYRVTLPNGAFRQILNGYMHIEFLGTREGNNCIS